VIGTTDGRKEGRQYHYRESIAWDLCSGEWGVIVTNIKKNIIG
jgi:hypothetical protein